MKRYVVLTVGGLLATAGALAQPGAGGPGHAGPADRQHAQRIAPNQREELRTLIRDQRATAREEERSQRQMERSQRQLSPQEREQLREQLRQQRREQRNQP